ncbi:MAG: hypothetical protein KKH94_04000 [Candidatus Omnitrophica bacterium]|nr:hypothetical protein [Candidatus Omnitrophota bacterium]
MGKLIIVVILIGLAVYTYKNFDQFEKGTFFENIITTCKELIPGSKKGSIAVVKDTKPVRGDDTPAVHETPPAAPPPKKDHVVITLTNGFQAMGKIKREDGGSFTINYQGLPVTFNDYEIDRTKLITKEEYDEIAKQAIHY